MLSKLDERRKSVGLSNVVDDALDLAEDRGWRYAIAYLVSERVPSPIIQRLLFGGARARSRANRRHAGAPPWNGSDTSDMTKLFDWLRQRKPAQFRERAEAPRASRPSAPFAEVD